MKRLAIFLRFILLGHVRVDDFGAKGDGITNDTEAVHRALAYIGGRRGRVVFKDKTYRLDAQVSIPSGVTIGWEGSVSARFGTQP